MRLLLLGRVEIANWELIEEGCEVDVIKTPTEATNPTMKNEDEKERKK